MTNYVSNFDYENDLEDTDTQNDDEPILNLKLNHKFLASLVELFGDKEDEFHLNGNYK